MIESEQKGNDARPVIRWAGGKGQLLTEILTFSPKEFNAYHEPFIGGGAPFFALRNAGRLKGPVRISDLNHRLVTLYQTIQQRPEEVIKALQQFDQDKSKAAFMAARQEFNRGMAARRTGMMDMFAPPPPPSPVRMTALFIFLNRLCFNGLFRENSDGEFNVSYDPSAITRDVVREDVIYTASHALEGVEITEEDFTKALARAGGGDFTFLDPPYVALSETASFSNYTADGFGMDQQARLARACRELDSKGAKFLMCNSAHPSVLKLYQGFRVEFVSATRNINCVGEGRGPIQEVMIMNYSGVTP